MSRRNRVKKQQQKPRDFWQSYSDMMAAVLLVFILALVGSILGANLNIEAREQALKEKETELDRLILEKKDLQKIKDELADQLDEQLNDNEKLLAEKQALRDELLDVKEKLRKATEENEALKAQIEDLNSTIAGKNKLLLQKQSEADAQREELEKIVGVRQSLIEKISTEFEDTDLIVDQQTGAISFKSTLLFDKSKDILKPEGKEFLEDFFPKYVDILLSDEFIDSVAEIIIEGHTDNDGSYMYNLQLSQDRALAVASYFLGDDGKGSERFSPKVREKLRQIVTANGKSFSELETDENGEVDKAASRRVEIQFRLKDEEMILSMMEAMGVDVNND